MKANEAPEKVYMPNELLSEEWQRHIEGEDTEYIRADAFIEKACEKLRQLMYDSLMYQGRLERYKVIDNFIEDFKKRIKGE